jgi:3-methyladenine DNA glycosylase AlkD
VDRSENLLNTFETEIRQRLRGLATTARLRAVRREFSKRIALMPANEVIELALRLRGGQVPDFFPFELILNHPAAMAGLNAKSVEALGEGIDSWVAVDTFACFVAGPAWREGRISDDVIRKWARSNDRWWRRAAVVSTVALNNKARGGRGDTRRTLEICEMLARDRDDMVVKALSWALRELSKRDSPAVKSFLKTHADLLAPRVKREVNNKLTTGLKNP